MAMFDKLQESKLSELEKTDKKMYDVAINYLHNKDEEVNYFNVQKAMFTVRDAYRRLMNNFAIIRSLGNEKKIAKAFLDNEITYEELTILSEFGYIKPTFALRIISMSQEKNNSKNDNSPEKKVLKGLEDKDFSINDINKFVKYGLIDEEIMNRLLALQGIVRKSDDKSQSQKLVTELEPKKHNAQKVIHIDESPSYKNLQEHVKSGLKTGTPPPTKNVTILEPKQPQKRAISPYVDKIVSFEEQKKDLLQNNDIANALYYTRLSTAEENVVNGLIIGDISREEIDKLISYALIDEHKLKQVLKEKSIEIDEPTLVAHL